jgi:hypothetical protein
VKKQQKKKIVGKYSILRIHFKSFGGYRLNVIRFCPFVDKTFAQRQKIFSSIKQKKDEESDEPASLHSIDKSAAAADEEDDDKFANGTKHARKMVVRKWRKGEQKLVKRRRSLRTRGCNSVER